jgi:acyl-CoA reductase-like NAD-dependent aldehyde dehydrogenase
MNVQVPHPENGSNGKELVPDRRADLLRKLEAMKALGRGRPQSSARHRLDAIERIEKAMVRRQQEIADTISSDFGHRSKHDSLIADVYTVVAAAKYVRKNLRAWMRPERRETGWPFLPGRSWVEPQPLGVIGIISPWNYPLNLALIPLIYAIAAGNRAMIKPSELAPATAELMLSIVRECFPPDEVDVITGGPEIGEAFSRLPFDHLFFTGSTQVGKLVMKAAAENLVPVTLELGGKSPAIIGEGMGPDAVAPRIISPKLLNAGQTCIAPDYLLVREDRRDAIVEALKRACAASFPRLADNPDYTSIINDRHFRRLQGLLEDARSKGATLVELNAAGEQLDPAKRKMVPTLVLDPKDEMKVMQEEIFGPILPVVTYRSFDEALSYVNARPRPLALYYLGYDRKQIDRVLAETISGGVSINDPMLQWQEDLPFGGVGASGMGSAHGQEGFAAMSKIKPIFEQSRLSGSFLIRQPYGAVIDRLLKVLIR